MLFGRRERARLRHRLRDWVWPRSGWRRALTYLWYRIVRISGTPHRIAVGIASGVFVSFTPFIGLHFLLAALIALALKGNVLASAIGTVVGNPLTFPLIWMTSYNIGMKLLGRTPSKAVADTSPPDLSVMLLEPSDHAWGRLWAVLEPMLLPMTIGGALLGLVFAAISYYIARIGIEAYQSRRNAGRMPARDQGRPLMPNGEMDDRRP
ncbi:DUF2062 domain-containing protein [Rhodoligotrophos defluvii]|uniref:DUF2062 domain-containing protein n=1 Tax=Rhodoligotrophos defluvii TaxID=2561934 RepID=UPI001485ADAA|nr:DUF2062 domain-containing protein [Rhodoligotrophos defluvii]